VVKFFKNLLSSSSNDNESNCKYLIVPDLHGTYSLFQKVEEYIKNESEDERIVIFLGDYLDRGESMKVFGREFHDGGSYHTLRGILKLQEWARNQERQIHFLRGNHEIFFEDFFLKDRTKPYDKYPFFRESVEALEFAFEHDYTLHPRFETFLDNLLPYYLDKENGYLFIHAGVDFSVGNLKEQAKKGTIYWIRDKFIYDKSPLPYTVVFGHTPFSEPFITDYRIGLDSGIYDSGFINLLKIDNSNKEIIKLVA
jgi:serine/threonine protein phosphatase 1